MKQMKIIIKGNNIKLSDSLKDYIDEKIGRLTRYYDKLQSAEVELLKQDNKAAEQSQRVEVTLSANGTIFRCEEASISMYASIDIVSEKLERQLKRYKQKQVGRGRGKAIHKEPFQQTVPITEETEPDRDPEIVKVKRFPVKPMNPVEASLQMEMLNHTFFVFLNDESEKVSVIYRRTDGDYGLIEPEL